MKTFAILTDVTRCIGCEECVLACKRENATGEADAPWKWQDGATTLSASRWTTITRTEQGRYVREQCRHCLEPACVDACPVQALVLTPEGVVTYNPEICLGCRYCILACPFRATRFEYGSANPKIGKCIMCYDNIVDGRLSEPACTAACPTGATIFGQRDQLIAEARQRIEHDPEHYIDHIWGEHELGGTSVLMISDVDLVRAGWPPYLTDEPITHLTHTIMHTVPFTFLGVAAGLGAISWVIQRRRKLALEADVADDGILSAARDSSPAEGEEQS